MKIGLMEKLKDNKKIKVLVIIGFIGILLIFLSDFIPKGEKKSENKVTENNFSAEAYEKNMEKKLTSILSEIKGTGSIKVMVSLEGGYTTNYARQVKKTSETGEKDTAQSYEDSIAMNKNGEALTESISEPKIKGVLVVCDGGGNITVKSKIIEAVSKLLSISSADICVTN